MTQRDEKWAPLAPWFPFYEASNRGEVRSVDRVLPDGRKRKGVVLKPRAGNRGYLLINVRDADGNVVTKTVHTLVLLAHAGPCPPGQESLHGPGGQQDNRWPENLRWGTKKENAADKEYPPVPPEPTYECINHVQCGGKVPNPGRRCLPCVEQVGREAAEMLNQGISLRRVAKRFGYTTIDWPYQIAVKHGGYAGSKRQAREQRPTLSQWVTITRSHLRRRADAPSLVTQGDREPERGS